MQNPPNTREHEWTILDLIRWTTGYFTSHGIDSPRTTAEILLAHALQIKKIDLYLRYDQPLLKKELSAYKSIIKRRIDREPVAYITGKKEFWSLELCVCPDVLIPRPDTECLVETALGYLSRERSAGHSSQGLVLELGVGSGAVVIALAHERPAYRFIASDISLKAIRVAKKNAEKHGMASIDFFVGNWLNPFSEKPLFDMILSNPPYIPSGDIKSLQPEVSRFEPMIALDGGKSDGLDAISEIILSAHRFLKPKGILLLEIGFDQKEKVSKIIENCSYYGSFSIIKDYAGHDRVALLHKI